MKIATASPPSYHALMRTFHWLMALCFIALFVSGAIMVEFDSKDSLRAAFYNFHKSTGALIIALVLLRLLVRWTSKTPPLPDAIPAWERKLAHAGHAFLYLMMVAAPLSGYATSDVYGYGVKFFDLPLPKLFPTIGPEAGAEVGDLHTVMAYAFLVVIGIHLAAIAKHRYVDRHCVMHRMA